MSKTSTLFYERCRTTIQLLPVILNTDNDHYVILRRIPEKKIPMYKQNIHQNYFAVKKILFGRKIYSPSTYFFQVHLQLSHMTIIDYRIAPLLNELSSQSTWPSDLRYSIYVIGICQLPSHWQSNLLFSDHLIL